MISLVAASESSCIKPVQTYTCACLDKRIATVWNGFLILLERLLSWCGEKIYGVGAPSELPAFPNLHRDMFKREKQTALRCWYLGVKILDWQDKFQFDHFAFAGPKERIEKRHELHLAAVPLYTNRECNYTENLLSLGADPNSNHNGYTPLRCAVLSGCFLAYETLRSAGGDPMLSTANNTLEKEETILGLLQRMHASPLSVGQFFEQEVLWCRYGEKFQELFTAAYRQGSVEFGTKEDVKKMIELEATKEILAYWQGPPPLARIIANYY